MNLQLQATREFPLENPLAKIFRLLDVFAVSADGQVYVAHIKDLLRATQQRYEDSEQVHQEVIRQIISLLSPHTGNNPALRAKFNILKIHLQAPVSGSDLSFVRQFMHQLAGEATPAAGEEKSSIRPFAPPLKRSSLNTAASVPATTPLPAETAAQSRATQRRISARDRIRRENEASLAYRHHLSRTTQEIRKIRDDFARHVDEAIAHNQQFGVLLEIELDALQTAVEMETVEERRAVLIEELEKFIKRHRVLARKFDSASKYLQVVETDNKALSDELDRVRLLSLTDELTGLPNRRAFMKRLEDELGRVNRYGTPISLVLIDLDLFKEINDRHGHAAGDAVLRAYADNVLSAFRHHDMVARYGGEEFAVILPNTGGQGTQHALAKAQEYALHGQCTYSGGTIALPTFSAGLAEYIPGESAPAFIERVDAALYRAKQSGRNRMVMAGAAATGDDTRSSGQI